MQLVAKPQQFDVMVMPNLCVDIISFTSACLEAHIDDSLIATAATVQLSQTSVQVLSEALELCQVLLLDV